MAKTKDEIKELLSTELFKSGIANNYITINSDSSQKRMKTILLDLILEENLNLDSVLINNLSMGCGKDWKNIMLYNKNKRLWK